MFDFLLPEHSGLIRTLVGPLGDREMRKPDLTIAPDGKPYIYRWHLIPRNEFGANCYLHLQVADDPERPLHDHPWDNQSVILAGGYREVYRESYQPSGDKSAWHLGHLHTRDCHVGRVIHRRAEEAHRIVLLPGVPYTISLFTTGPVVRDWGFWFDPPRGWVPHTQVLTDTPDGRSIFKDPQHG